MGHRDTNKTWLKRIEKYIESQINPNHSYKRIVHYKQKLAILSRTLLDRKKVNCSKRNHRTNRVKKSNRGFYQLTRQWNQHSGNRVWMEGTSHICRTCLRVPGCCANSVLISFKQMEMGRSKEVQNFKLSGFCSLSLFPKTEI